MKEELRKRVMAVSKEEVCEVAQRYLLERMKRDKSAKVVFGSAESKLEGFVEKGWRVVQFSDKLSVRPEMYEQDELDKEEEH